jgi:aminoglycoside phosphotransferase family enzyme/predicted kinase
VQHPDELIDWAVMMRRFDDRQLFNRLATGGQLSAAMVVGLAEVVARFHAQQTPAPPGFGRAEATRHVARQNLAELAALLNASGSGLVLPMPGAAASVLALQGWTELRGAELAMLMDLRCRTGHVREVHGDLHLGNIVWAEGAPVLFDALEFNDTMRHIDTVGDLAFTFMDLIAYGLPRLAWLFISTVLEASGDHAALPLLAWWAVHRATVRAKVTLLGAAGQGVDAHAAITLAQRYLGVATRLAGLDRSAPPPRLVLTFGLSGSGKTGAAAQLAQRLGAIRVRSDVERKRLFALPATGRSTPGLYAPDANRRTYERLQEVADLALAAGVSIVVDAASLQRQERDAMRAVAARHGAPFHLLVCQAPLPVLQARVAARHAEGRDASDATPEVLARQQQWAEWPGADEAADTCVLDTDGSLDEVAQRIEALPF